MGVPCSSVPLAMSTREPRSLSKRARTSAGTAKPATWPMWRGPLAYGQAGATRTVLRSTDHKRKLAARAISEGRPHLVSGAAKDFFMELGQLAPDGELALGQHLGDHRERFDNAVRRVERDSRSRVSDESGEQPANLTGLARKIAEECKPGPTIACERQGRGNSARTRNR